MEGKGRGEVNNTQKAALAKKLPLTKHPFEWAEPHTLQTRGELNGGERGDGEGEQVKRLGGKHNVVPKAG